MDHWIWHRKVIGRSTDHTLFAQIRIFLRVKEEALNNENVRTTGINQDWSAQNKSSPETPATLTKQVFVLFFE